MFLALDVGNTEIDAGIFEGEKLLHSWRLATDPKKTADEYAVLLYNFLTLSSYEIKDVKEIAISSVVPPLTPVLVEMCRYCFQTEPLVVGPGVKSGMPIRYEEPKSIGADRIVNGVAAFHYYGGPVVVVDFGTATTFDVVSEKGEYLGGLIAPGVGISLQALFTSTAQLPWVDFSHPSSVIGKNTVDSIKAGALYGFAGQVEGIIRRIEEELQRKVKVIATGGWAKTVAKVTSVIKEVEPYLVLKGLYLIYEKNR